MFIFFLIFIRWNLRVYLGKLSFSMLTLNPWCYILLFLHCLFSWKLWKYIVLNKLVLCSLKWIDFISRVVKYIISSPRHWSIFLFFYQQISNLGFSLRNWVEYYWDLVPMTCCWSQIHLCKYKFVLKDEKLGCCFPFTLLIPCCMHNQCIGT